MDRGAWRARVHRVAKRQTQLKQLGMRAELLFGDDLPLGTGLELEKYFWADIPTSQMGASARRH